MEEQVGTVITYPFKSSDLWDDMSGVLCLGSDIIDVVKIDHLCPSGNYYVVGDKFTGEMNERMYLAKLYIQDSLGKSYQLKFSQWKTAIKSRLVNNNKSIKFNLLPSQFKPGYYIKACVECGSHYSGDKRSQICEDCSSNNRFAKLIIDKEIKSKRPRIKNNETI